jgi:hypothetical protein
MNTGSKMIIGCECKNHFGILRKRISKKKESKKGEYTLLDKWLNKISWKS